MKWLMSLAMLSAFIIQDASDSRELQLQDMLVLSMLPRISADLQETYSMILTVKPQIYPYDVDIKDVQRVNGFRGFDFIMTLKAHPVIGPHLSVGEDLLTYRISPSVGMKLMKIKHLKGPTKEALPQNYKGYIK